MDLTKDLPLLKCLGFVLLFLFLLLFAAAEGGFGYDLLWIAGWVRLAVKECRCLKRYCEGWRRRGGEGGAERWFVLG